MITSSELYVAVNRLTAGLISEAEFVALLQLDAQLQYLLNKFDSLDPVMQNWDFTLDDFNIWVEGEIEHGASK